MSGSSSNEVAWVKLGQLWWPGKLLQEDEWSEQIKAEVKAKEDARKVKSESNQIHVVKFLNEPGHEIVTIPSMILLNVDEDKKRYIIKRTLSSMKASSLAENRDRFKKDVLDAERLAHPTADLIELEKFIDQESIEKRPLIASSKYADIFQTPQQPEKDNMSSTTQVERAVEGNNRIITTASSKTLLKVSPSSSEPSKRYNCYKCGFPFDRVNALMVHQKHCKAACSPHPKKVTSPAVTSLPASEVRSLETDLPRNHESNSASSTHVQNLKQKSVSPHTPIPTSHPTLTEGTKLTSAEIGTTALPQADQPKKRGRGRPSVKILSDKQKDELQNDAARNSEVLPQEPSDKATTKRKSDVTVDEIEEISNGVEKEKIEVEDNRNGSVSPSKTDTDERKPTDIQTPILKKARTDKELSAAFDSLLQNSQVDSKSLEVNNDKEVKEVLQVEEQRSDTEGDTQIIMKKDNEIEDRDALQQTSIKMDKVNDDERKTILPSSPTRKSALPSKAMTKNSNIRDKRENENITKSTIEEKTEDVGNKNGEPDEQKSTILDPSIVTEGKKSEIISDKLPETETKSQTITNQTLSELKEKVPGNQEQIQYEGPESPVPVSSTNSGENSESPEPVKRRGRKKKSTIVDAPEIIQTSMATRTRSRRCSGRNKMETNLEVVAKPEAEASVSVISQVICDEEKNISTAGMEDPEEKVEEVQPPSTLPVVVQQEAKRLGRKKRSAIQQLDLHETSPVPTLSPAVVTETPSSPKKSKQSSPVVDTNSVLVKESSPPLSVETAANGDAPLIRSETEEANNDKQVLLPPPPPIVMDEVQTSSPPKSPTKKETPTRSKKHPAPDQTTTGPPKSPPRPGTLSPAKIAKALASPIQPVITTISSSTNAANSSDPTAVVHSTSPSKATTKKPTAAIKPLIETKKKNVSASLGINNTKGTGTATASSKKKNLSTSVSEPSGQSFLSQQPEQDSGRKSPALVAQRVVHCVPVENQDGTLTYMFLSLDNESDYPELVQQGGGGPGQGAIMRIDKVELPGSLQRPLNETEVEGIFLDKDVDSASQLVNALVATASPQKFETATATEGVEQSHIIVLPDGATLSQDATIGAEGQEVQEITVIMTEDGQMQIVDPRTLGLTQEPVSDQ